MRNAVDLLICENWEIFEVVRSHSCQALEDTLNPKMIESSPQKWKKSSTFFTFFWLRKKSFFGSFRERFFDENVVMCSHYTKGVLMCSENLQKTARFFEKLKSKFRFFEKSPKKPKFRDPIFSSFCNIPHTLIYQGCVENCQKSWSFAKFSVKTDCGK